MAIVFLVGKKCLREVKRTSTIGTVSAIHAALPSELEKGNLNLKEIFSSADQQWRFLTADEYDRVIIELAKSHNLDPSPKHPSQPLLDFWGNRFEIGYRIHGRVYNFIVVSKGPNGIYGTKDDVVSEYGAVPPAKPEK